jgi:nicotinate-nucleotide pyrophosphorylase
VLIERDLRIRIAADAKRVAEEALAEDGGKDITTAVCLAPEQFGTGMIEFKSGGVLAGMPYADAVAEACSLLPVTWYHAAGLVVPAGTTIGSLQGDLADILRADVPALYRAIGMEAPRLARLSR